ncbi:DUF3817 domain-containing protein [Propionibacteriaceae bacterium Y2011]|uniref:DUF3817 domain-containing protein n=1 Tax=Microlunatus sp. Y2014 TaxID=3418488 RepID=UPI003B4531CF
MTPKRLFTTLAFAEVVTWTLLLVGMALKYLTDTTELGVRIGGGLHGFVFLGYCVVTVLVGVSQRWHVGWILGGLLSAVVPYATIWFERQVTRRGMLGDTWRLGRGGAEPGWFGEHVVAWVLRHPVVAAVVAVVGVSVVFAVLLYLGPPIQVS